MLYIFILNQSDFTHIANRQRHSNIFWALSLMGWCFLEFSMKSCLLIFNMKMTTYICEGHQGKKRKNQLCASCGSGCVLSLTITLLFSFSHLSSLVWYKLQSTNLPCIWHQMRRWASKCTTVLCVCLVRQ